MFFSTNLISVIIHGYYIYAYLVANLEAGNLNNVLAAIFVTTNTHRNFEASKKTHDI